MVVVPLAAKADGTTRRASLENSWNRIVRKWDGNEGARLKVPTERELGDPTWIFYTCLAACAIS